MTDVLRGLALDEAVELTRTGDLWLFRGPSAADHAIRMMTNAPVNHVGMAIVLDDLPPLMWHAELGCYLRDVWTNSHHGGVQLHLLSEAVDQWTGRYRQRAWFRQLDAEVTSEMEQAVLEVVDRMDGAPFPTQWKLMGPMAPKRIREEVALQRSCVEAVTAAYTALGLLPHDFKIKPYDPGRYWSGDSLRLEGNARLGPEIPVDTP
jgi:hypothetical protein